MEAPIDDEEDWENLVFASWRSQSVEAVFLNLFASGIWPDVVGSFGRVIISDLRTWGISFHHSMPLVFLGKSLEAGEPGNRFKQYLWWLSEGRGGAGCLANTMESSVWRTQSLHSTPRGMYCRDREIKEISIFHGCALTEPWCVGELRGSEAYLKARGPGVSLTN